MKKVIFISLAIISISMVSCDKDYSCTCKDLSGNVTNKYTLKYPDGTTGKTAATTDCTGRISTTNGVCLLD